MKNFLLSFRLSQVSRLSAVISAAAIVSSTALLATMLLPSQAIAATDVCVLRQKHVKSGDWRTLESYWTPLDTATFGNPQVPRSKCSMEQVG